MTRTKLWVGVALMGSLSFGAGKPIEYETGMKVWVEPTNIKTIREYLVDINMDFRVSRKIDLKLLTSVGVYQGYAMEDFSPYTTVASRVGFGAKVNLLTFDKAKIYAETQAFYRAPSKELWVVEEIEGKILDWFVSIGSYQNFAPKITVNGTKLDGHTFFGYTVKIGVEIPTKEIFHRVELYGRYYSPSTKAQEEKGYKRWQPQVFQGGILFKF